MSPELLTSAIRVLETWYRAVSQQKARHVWSLLPPKYLGATPGRTVAYAESDDRAFMDRFLRLYPEEHPNPYFDPFSRQWLKANYYHSNMATFRKNRFAREWGACSWQDDMLSLADNYSDVVVERVLRKAGAVTRIPAIACAVWFFKRPSTEWPDDPDLRTGIPGSAADVVGLFRRKFHFQDDRGWAAMFDDTVGYIPGYADLLRASS